MAEEGWWRGGGGGGGIGGSGGGGGGGGDNLHLKGLITVRLTASQFCTGKCFAEPNSRATELVHSMS